VPLSTIHNTVTDLDGTPIEGAPVIIRLRPGPGFRVDDFVEVASEERTTTDASGFWDQPLERNANINPSGTYYEVEEQIPARAGGTRLWAVLVGDIDSSLLGALVVMPSARAAPVTLTQPIGDARYGAQVDTDRNVTARRLYLRTTVK